MKKSKNVKISENLKNFKIFEISENCNDFFDFSKTSLDCSAMVEKLFSSGFLPVIQINMSIEYMYQETT